MKVNVKVTLNQAALKNLEQIQRQALEMTAEAVLTDIKTSGVVPKDTNQLELSGFVDLTEIRQGIASIVFDTPYARRLYWHPEYNFRTDKNPHARGKWMEPYYSGEKKKFVQQTFAQFVKQLSKGMIK
ncbi:minor capsid protein [Paenibacillus motobuensis]|uniref:minor capsid protein n=1 Tax=Paenibacillus TaxID=44249 RepID=UPI00203C23EB|nr:MULTISPECIES: minor capsid protein [Paenibacillus]MCM3041713.1 minor capsid protein [Paenibacillus lutimineralis]MCM3648817.1 minor capsid protein [Paenibacillus motobuensis]